MGGGLRAVGVGGGVTGFGANLIIIDDPIKSRAEAESQTYRDNVHEWFNDDLYTRLEPDGAIILIQTRWHEDDLAGRLLRQMHEDPEAEQWEVIELPAFAEPKANDDARSEMSLKGTQIIARGKAESRHPGSFAQNDPDPAGAEQRVSDVAPLQGADEPDAFPGVPPKRLHPRLLSLSPSATKNSDLSASEDWGDELGRRIGDVLCPERFPEKKLVQVKRQLGTYSFSALYQQRPTPADGGIFKRKWFDKIVEFAPPGLRWTRGYDLAVSTRTTADHTASFRVAFGKDGDLYIDGGFRRRIEFPEQRRYILGRILAEPDTEHGIELALHGHAMMQELRREASIRGRPFRGVSVSGDKIARALTRSPLAEEGRVILVRGPWIDEFLDEVAAFPKGTHDDQVDAVSIAVRMQTVKRRTLHRF